jgi:parvulin-like peptidyl-prolyl isomerase
MAGGLAWALAGCTSAGVSRVREAALPDAQGIHADGTSLLPPMPVATTGPTRGQAQETPPPAALPQGVQTSGSAMPPPAGQVAVRIRAHVNGLPILEEELREGVVMRMGEVLALPEVRRAAYFQELAGRELERLIERELILQEAITKIKELKRPALLEQLKQEAEKEADRRIKEVKKATKVEGDEEFKALMRQQGLSVEGLRRQTERNFMMTEYVRNLIFPVVQRINIQQIREYYENHADQFAIPDRVKWMDLFVDASRFASPAAARQHAETIAQRAKAGEDFAALVKQFDHGDSSLRNGEGLGTKRGEIRPAQAEPVVFALKPGEVGPVIDMGFGFHVVKVVERDYAGREPFDEKCQAKVRDKLRQQIAEREYKRIVEELKRKATITIHAN